MMVHENTKVELIPDFMYFTSSYKCYGDLHRAIFLTFFCQLLRFWAISEMSHNFWPPSPSLCTARCQHLFSSITTMAPPTGSKRPRGSPSTSSQASKKSRSSSKSVKSRKSESSATAPATKHPPPQTITTKPNAQDTPSTVGISSPGDDTGKQSWRSQEHQREATVIVNHYVTEAIFPKLKWFNRHAQYCKFTPHDKKTLCGRVSQRCRLLRFYDRLTSLSDYVRNAYA